MDNITTTTESVPQTKHLLKKMIEILNWAGLTVKFVKCRALVIYKGKITSMDIKVEDKIIKSIQEMPIRYLGKQYTSSLDEKDQTECTIQQLKTDLRKLERCRLPGRYKC